MNFGFSQLSTTCGTNHRFGLIGHFEMLIQTFVAKHMSAKRGHQRFVVLFKL
jgi:hypothetical protein